MKLTPKERFLRHTQRADNGCLLWLGHIDKCGYGRFRLNGRCMSAHRASMELFTGVPVPTGMHVDHLCRTKNCVEHTHLEVVTCAVNTQRGNATTLTPGGVLAIRLVWEAGGVQMKEIARRARLQPATVGRIIHRQRWKNVE